MKLPLNALLESVLIGAISALFLILLSLVPILNFIILLWPVPLIVVGVRRGVWASVLSLMIAALVVGLLFHPLLLIFFIMYLFVVVGLSFAFRRKLDAFENVLLSSVSVTISLLLIFRIYALIAGETLFAVAWSGVRNAVTNGVIDFNTILSMYHQMGIFENFQSDSQFAEFLIGQMQIMVPSIVIIFSILLGVGNFLAARLVLKKLRYEVPHVPNFADWSLPKGMGFGFLALLLLSYLGIALGINNFEIVQLTLVILVTFVFTVQGLAVVWFFLRSGRVPSIIRWILIILIYLIIHVLLTYNMGLMFLGIFDQLFGLRTNYSNRFRQKKVE